MKQIEEFINDVKEAMNGVDCSFEYSRRDGYEDNYPNDGYFNVDIEVNIDDWNHEDIEARLNKVRENWGREAIGVDNDLNEYGLSVNMNKVENPSEWDYEPPIVSNSMNKNAQVTDMKQEYTQMSRGQKSDSKQDSSFGIKKLLLGGILGGALGGTIAYGCNRSKRKEGTISNKQLHNRMMIGTAIGTVVGVVATVMGKILFASEYSDLS